MIVLGLGSSDENSLGWLRRALAELKREPRFRILEVSGIYRSDAMLPSGAPESWNKPYLNLALKCETQLKPEEALPILKGMELTLGRRERERWAPREIDIDVLAWDSLVLDTPCLKIPHPGLPQRPFALLPFEDVWPDWVHPTERRTARELAHRMRALPDEEVPFRTTKILASLSELVGILNLTPDSFSDGGRLTGAEAIVQRAQALVDAGATILDFGAESTRPGAQPLADGEEWRRLEAGLLAIGAVKGLRSRFKLSIDSRNPETIARALSFGVDWVNDVEGFANSDMIRLAAQSGASVVFMHSLGVPPSRDRVIPLDEDPVEVVLRWGEERAKDLLQAGIPQERLIFDPGIGFGKTPLQNLALLKGARRFHRLGLPVLIGHSRKSYLAQITHRPPAERDFETSLVTSELAACGVEYLRVHDAEMQARALAFRSGWETSTRWHT